VGLESQQREARSALEDTYLRAPFTGYVTGKFVENYTKVRSDDPIVSLQDVSQVEIVIDVPEREIAAITGDGVRSLRASFDAFPGKEYDLRVKETGLDTDPNTQTYPVTLTMPQPAGLRVLPGMTATVTYLMPETGSRAATVARIPSSAVFADENGNQFVWRLDTHTMQVSRGEVSVDGLTGNALNILDGLNSGDVIVTAGVHFLRDGQKVRYLSKPAEAE
jgi:RND family efflux transporter MFP subunit